MLKVSTIVVWMNTCDNLFFFFKIFIFGSVGLFFL